MTRATLVVHLPSAVAVVTTVVMAATRGHAEHEAAEEDDRHDEHAARDDADPCSDGVQLAAPMTLVDVARLHDGGRRRGRLDR
jgi:hypothetical protein